MVAAEHGAGKVQNDEVRPLGQAVHESEKRQHGNLDGDQCHVDKPARNQPDEDVFQLDDVPQEFQTRGALHFAGGQRRFEPHRLHRGFKGPEQLHVGIGRRRNGAQTPDKLVEHKAAQENHHRRDRHHFDITADLRLGQFQLLERPHGQTVVVQGNGREPHGHALVPGQQNGRFPNIGNARAIRAARQPDHPRADIRRNGRVDKREEHQPSPMEFRHEPIAQANGGKRGQHPQDERPLHRDIPAPLWQIFHADFRRMMPGFPLYLALFQQGFAHHVKPGERDHDRRADPKAQPEVKAIGNARGNRRHARRPSAQHIRVEIEHGIDHQIAEHRADKGPDHHVKRQDEPEQHMPQIRSQPKHRSGQDGLDFRRKVDEWNGQNLNGLGEENARQRGHDHVEQAPDEADTRSRAKHAPPPTLGLGRGLGQCGTPARVNRLQRKGQLLDVAGNAKHHVPKGQARGLVDDHDQEQNQHRQGPVRMDEGALGIHG